VNLLLDTHLLVWAVTSPRRMSHVAAGLIEDPDNNVFFSPISIWEIVVKSALNRADFTVDPVHLNDFY
jgi:PIN domain nuclease of toxin-antitoxin system